MTVLEFSRVSSEALYGVDAVFEAGVHAVLADVNDGGADLVAIAAGVLSPRRGRVRLSGLDPRRHPLARRHIGSLLCEERWAFAPTVGDGVRAVLSARSDRRTARDVLEPWGLDGWAPRPGSSLSPREARALSLALASTVPEARLLALHEPLSTGLDSDRVLCGLRERASRGAVVLAVTSSAAEAALLASRAAVLRRGRFVGQVPAPGAAPPSAPVPLRVGTRDPRALTLALASAPGVTRAEWDAARRSREVVVYGESRDEVALAILRAARETGVRIDFITEREIAPFATTAPREKGGLRGWFRRRAV